MSESEITKVQLVIRRFLFETKEVVKDAEKSKEWLTRFRDTLLFQDDEKDPCEYALLLLSEAKLFNDKQRQKALSRRKNPQDAPNGNAGVDRKSATSCDQFTADGDVREDSHDGKFGTSANIYGDAATREGAEDCHHPINGTIAHTTTVSKNMRRVPQNEAPAHGFSGGRTAQGTMSRSPEAAARSGKSYDQEPIEISTNRRRTGGPSLSQTSSLPPVRQSEPDVLSLAYSGEFKNVRLTQEQYNELGIRFGNLAKLNRAIDSLSCQIENGEKNPKNHYAELVKWANYRDDMDEAEEVKAAKQPHYETVSEHNARIVAEGKKWIDEHFPKKDKKHG